MAEPIIFPREFKLMQQELEALGEQLKQEVAQRREEIERLHFELDSLKHSRETAMGWHPLRIVPPEERRALHFTPPEGDEPDEARKTGATGLK